MTKSIRKPWTNITRCYVAMLIKQRATITEDVLYEKLASEAALYAVAFFGHHSKPGDKKLLNYLCKVAGKIAGETTRSFNLNTSWVHGKFNCGVIDTHLGAVEVFTEDYFAQGDDGARAIDEIHQIWLYLDFSVESCFEVWISRNFYTVVWLCLIPLEA